MSEIANTYVRKLLAQTNCPVCGATREFTAGEFTGIQAMNIYLCGAELITCKEEIVSSRHCPAASMTAVRQLNAEASHDAAEALKVGADE